MLVVGNDIWNQSEHFISQYRRIKVIFTSRETVLNISLDINLSTGGKNKNRIRNHIRIEELHQNPFFYLYFQIIINYCLLL